MSSPRAPKKRSVTTNGGDAMAYNAGYTCVRLVGGQELVVAASLSSAEIVQCLRAAQAEDRGDPIALRDVATRVVFPLSLLARAPRRFQDGEFEVVFADTTTATTAATHTTTRQYDHHGYDQGSVDVDLASVAADAGTPPRRKRRSKHHAKRHHRRDPIGRPEFVDAYDLLPRGGRIVADETEDETTDPRRRQSDMVVERGDDDNHDDDNDDDVEQELLRELDLTDFELPQLVHVFTQACPRGEMDRTVFDTCLEKILSQTGRYDPQARTMFERLFRIFDADNEGVVDVAEFLGGVSVFASGQRDDKIRGIFDLYDGDHDGRITLVEMTKYLTAVFIVIAETSPELFQQNTVDPMELGAVTAQRCFEEAHVPPTGQLSFQAFQDWYSKPAPAHLLSEASETPESKPREKHSKRAEDLSLGRLRELTGLENLSADDLFSLFSTAALTADGDPTGNVTLTLSRSAFKKCFFKILQMQRKKPTRALARFLDRLFNGLDRDGNDTVDYVELSSGLSILCGGSRDEKVVAAFSLFDADGDGFITRQEMETYLMAVFSVVYESHQETKHAMGIDAAQLAKYTTAQAFADADRNHDGKLSLDEFRTWYTHGGEGLAMHHQPVQYHMPPSHQPTSFSSITHNALTSMDQIAATTGLRFYTPSDVFELLASHVNDDGVLSRDAVHEVFTEVLANKQQHAPPSPQGQQEEAEIQGFVEALFDAFDADGDGFVDFCELASGLSVCCDGSQHEKVRAAFTLFDINEDGFLTTQDMETYLASVFRMLFTASSSVDASISADELARVTTREAFAAWDADHDGRLTEEEFRRWYTTATGSGFGASSVRSPLTMLPSTSKHTLKEMQVLTNLGAYDVNDILEFFQASADTTGNVAKPAFSRCFHKLVMAAEDKKTPEDQLRAQQLLEELFALFDTDGNGVIDVQELGAGLSILCGGNMTDKTRSLFTLYDLNHDGFISPSEMQSYLTSVFKVLYKASPELVSTTGGLSPTQLALATTQECFQSFDKNHDQQLSYDEFHAWIDQQKAHSKAFAATGAIPHAHVPVSSSAAATGSVDDDAGVIHIDVAKKLTGLHALTLDQVAQLFASASNGSGQLTRDAFDRCFYQYVTAAAPLDADESTRVHEVIDRLFTAFDSDGNGLLDAHDLVSGVSILCGAGTRDETVQAAFDRYDANGDGLISQGEMVHYLSCVFKLLYALDPTRHANLGVPPDDLAVITATEIFAQADTDHDGKLTLEEFKLWYGYGTQTHSQSPTQSPPFHAMVAPLDLDQVRKLTNLGSLDVVEVFERFAEHADEEGLLYRSAFDECMVEIIEMASPHQSRSELEMVRAKVIADRLFEVFDQDRDGRIDFSELASGLSVLCKGAREAKVQAAFRLYDFNGDGYISLDEMTRYLTSIFKVLYEVQPHMQHETGVSADELGHITAEQAFLEADQNEDGKLSYDEFLTWYNSPSQAGISSVVAKNAIVDSSLQYMPLNEIKSLTNLAQYEPDEVFEVFAAEANQEGLLSREAFHASFQTIFKGDGATSASVAGAQRDAHKVESVVNDLFDLFDADHSGFVDFGELASGLSVLCGGTQQQKVRAAFALFDFNGDGFISMDEMTRYLTSVFKVLFQVSPPENTAHLRGVSAEELGEITAHQAFQEADHDHDGRLTFDEFQQWYSRPGSIGQVAKHGEQLFSLAEARRLTNDLQAFSPVEVFEALADCADEEGYVSKRAFDDCFRDILTRGQPGIRGVAFDRITAILNRLFELFDSDKNGKVDFSEISSGLSVVCGGSSDDSIKAAFALYDYNGDGVISLDEMTRYLTAVFKVLQEASPRDALSDESPEALASCTAVQAFHEADKDTDGKLTFDEFRAWYTTSNTANIERLIENNIPEWLSLQEVRRLTNLGAYSPGEVFETFASFASASEGTLNKDAFRRALMELQRSSPREETEETEETGVAEDQEDQASNYRLRVLVDRIFGLFDADQNGVVDFSELASGLSVLCGGTETDKARAAFNLYDVNHDGFISLGEMRLYLTSVFKVLFELNPNTQANMGGISPEELGEITAEQAFTDADADGDGQLSFEEFRSWYLQPGGGGSLDPSMEDAPQVPEWVSLQVVKEMTNLDKYAPNDVFEVFANRCGDDGTISREAFEDCFEQLIDAKFKTDEPHLARVRVVLDRLFAIFDADGNGIVDFCELSSGLSVLCGGSREDKVRSAFALYDLNQDGFISLEEMVRYLTSVFKVLYETTPGTADKLGVQPDELALITAEQCFVEADLNHDGRLSFDEFVHWYSKTYDMTAAPPASVTSMAAAQHQQWRSQQHSSNGNGDDNGHGTGNGNGTGGDIDIDMEEPPADEENGKSTESNESYPTSKLYTASRDGDNTGLPVPLSPAASSGFSMTSASMERARRLLKLDSYEVNDIFEIFAEAAPSGELNFSNFKKCFDQIIKLAGGHETNEEKQEAEQMTRRLFRVFDTDKSNTVDFGELASGLSVMSGSSMDDKVRAAFQLYDVNGDGYISVDEMVSYMTSIFKVMYETSDAASAQMGNVEPEELARVTATQCFKEADLNNDGKLSFEEFKKWCTSAV